MSMEEVNLAIEREHIQELTLNFGMDIIIDTTRGCIFWGVAFTIHMVRVFPITIQEDSEEVLGGWKTEQQLGLLQGWDE